MESLDSMLARYREMHRVSTEESSRQRVLFASVSESSPSSVAEALLMVRSLRRYGGRLADVDVRLFFVETLPAEGVGPFIDLGVDVRTGPRLFARCPHANKLAMFADAGAYDFLVALDTDTVVVGDITDHLVGGSLAARPEAGDHVGTGGWQLLLDHFGIAAGGERYITTLTRQEMIVPYFNSGVLIVPSALVQPLQQAWTSWVARLLDAWDDVPLLKEQRYFTDEIALTMALLDTGLPRRTLPLAMHTQTCYPAHPMHGPGTEPPLILHHHHRLGATGLHPGATRGVNDAIATLNAALFDGRSCVGADLTEDAA